MKSIAAITLYLLLSVSAFAKMVSKVEIQHIQTVSIEANKITIIGHGTFISRMVTTEEKKDSNFVIMGQPSAAYTAQGDAVAFTITPYTLELNDPNGELAQDPEILELKKRLQADWVRTMEIAEALKPGDQVEISVQGSDVRFHEGQLQSVTGQGMIISPKS